MVQDCWEMFLVSFIPQNLTLRDAEKAILSFATVRQEMGTENKDFCVPCR